MQKARKCFLAIAGKLLLIGFGIQIVFGLLWMLRNFTGVQQFGETDLYVEISKTFICDEYVGILYPVLILLARGIEQIFRVPFHCILYLVQLGMAGFAGYRLFRAFPGTGKLYGAWGSLAMLTFPITMQCHLAVLPESLAGSFLLLELACMAEAFREGGVLRSRQFVKVLSCGLVSALLMPEYLYLCAPSAVFLFLYGIVKSLKGRKEKILHNSILAVVFVALILSMGQLTTVPGYYGRVHPSLSFALVSRSAWPRVSEDYEYWPEEVRQAVPSSQAFETDFYADQMDLLLGAALEKAVGEQRAEELFREMAAGAWQRHKKDILHDTAWDALGYTFAPMVVQRQFEGKVYDSFSGRNYEIMRFRAPILTKHYWNYCSWWFAMGLLLAAAVRVVNGVEYFLERKRKKKDTAAGYVGGIKTLSACLITALGIVIVYTLRGAGMMDYKKAIAVTALWIWWMLTSCLEGMETDGGAHHRSSAGVPTGREW